MHFRYRCAPRRQRAAAVFVVLAACAEIQVSAGQSGELERVTGVVRGPRLRPEDYAGMLVGLVHVDSPAPESTFSFDVWKRCTPGPGVTYDTRPDERGAFVLHVPRRSELALVAYSRRLGWSAVASLGDEPRAVELEFRDVAIVRGTVVLPDGRLATDAHVPSDDWIAADSAGRFEFACRPGRREFAAFAPSVAGSATQELELAPGEIRELRLALRKPARLDARISLEGSAASSWSIGVVPFHDTLDPLLDDERVPDSEGRFSVFGLAPGKYGVIAVEQSDPPLAFALQSITTVVVAEGETRVLDLMPPEERVIWRGRVLDDVEPVRDATFGLQAVDEGHWTYGGLETDANGEFHVQLARPTTFWLRPERGELCGACRVRLDAPGELVRDIELPRGSLAVRADVDLDLTGANVLVRRADAGLESERAFADAGVALFERLAPGECEVRIEFPPATGAGARRELPRFATWSGRVTIADGRRTELAPEFAPPAGLEGRARVRGRAVPVRVTVAGAEPDEFDDPLGRYRLLGVPAGRRTVTIERLDRAAPAVTRVLDLLPNAFTRVDFELLD